MLNSFPRIDVMSLLQAITESSKRITQRIVEVLFIMQSHSFSINRRGCRLPMECIEAETRFRAEEKLFRDDRHTCLKGARTIS